MCNTFILVVIIILAPVNPVVPLIDGYMHRFQSVLINNCAFFLILDFVEFKFNKSTNISLISQELTLP